MIFFEKKLKKYIDISKGIWLYSAITINNSRRQRRKKKVNK